MFNFTIRSAGNSHFAYLKIDDNENIEVIFYDGKYLVFRNTYEDGVTTAMMVK